jgi:hypothetical protein
MWKMTIVYCNMVYKCFVLLTPLNAASRNNSGEGGSAFIHSLIGFSYPFGRRITHSSGEGGIVEV